MLRAMLSTQCLNPPPPQSITEGNSQPVPSACNPYNLTLSDTF